MSVEQASHFDVADLLPRLTSEFGYKPPVAKQVAERLACADPQIRVAFWRWWETGEIDNALEIEGYTIERLMTERKLKPVAAFSTLVWLRSDPQQALSTLRRGFDRVTFRSRPSKEPN
jgi:hypothetical protein